MLALFRTPFHLIQSLLLLTLVMLVVPISGAMAIEVYSNSRVADEAARYDALLRDENKRPGKNFVRLMREGQTLLAAGKYPEAAKSLGAAYVAGGGPRALLLLSGALLNTKPIDYRDRYLLPEHAGAAAYLAYTKSTSDRAKADALVFVAKALEQRQRWRETLDALKASLALVEQRTTRNTYEDLYKKHGFRLTNYTIDSDSAEPRLCVNFSEKLKSDGEYEKYVQAPQLDKPAVSVSGLQMCIEGLRHGQRYKIDLRAGLPAAIDDRLQKPVHLEFYVKDRSPAVRLSGNKYVLPRTGQTGIPVTSVNTDKVYIQIHRIGDRALNRAVQDDFLQQLSGYGVSEIKNQLGQKVWDGTLDVEQRLNEDVITAFPVMEAIPQLEAGVYVMVADAEKRDEYDWHQKATQWFVVSDLGIAALSAEDGINAFVRSLASAETVAGVTVRLIAKNNEVLGTGVTDGGGFVNFPAALARGEGGMAPALLVAQTKIGDYAFLDLSGAAFDLSDRGVAGRTAPGPVDVMLFTERGVYKPGETVHLTGLVRDQNAKALSNLPLTVKFVRADGLEYRRELLKDQGLGGRSFSLSLDPGVPTGTWRAIAYLDVKEKPIGETTFLVEDFVPERMDMELTPETKILSPNKPLVIDVAGKYLYGAPARDHGLEGEIEIREHKGQVEGFTGYTFGLENEDVKATRHPLTDLPRTNDKGKAQINAELPMLPEVTKPLEAKVTLRLRDPSGRALERALTLPIRSSEPLIGIKPLFSDLGENSTAEFEIAVMGPDGKQTAYRNLSWEILELDTRYQWYNRDGRWDYETITSEKRLARGKISARRNAPVRVSAPVGWGRYRLDVHADGQARPAASTYFNAGWYASALSETPDMLDVALDKRDYKIGETAKLRIVSRMAGKGLITVLNNGIRAMKSVAVPEGASTVELTVDENWGAGAHVAVNLYRPMSVADKRMPSRAVGLKWLTAGHEQHVLQVGLETPERIRPDGGLDIPVSIDGMKPGSEAYVVAAAVDVGILNLTRYQPPAPEDWFLAQRKLSTEFRDLYGKLIDGMGGVRGSIRQGGDGMGEAGQTMTGNPPEQKPLALFTGLIKVDESGKANLHFDIPPFNGTVKVMTVAWSRDKVGHAVKNVIVRDPVIVMGTAPHFLKKGDRSQLHLTLHNVDGPAGSYELELASDGLSSPITRPQKLAFALQADERRNLDVPLAPDAIGTATVTAKLNGPNGLAIARSYAIDVKPPYPNVTRQSVQLVSSGARLVLTNELFTGIVPGTETATLAVGPSSLPDVPGLLASLDRYPYGCSEQITSRALPLLYLSSVADQVGLPETKQDELKETVQKAIDKLISRQDSDGAFGLWSTGNGGTWLSAYVTEFLSRAREQGFTVQARAMSQALDKLSNTVGYASDFDKGGEDIAYSLYVLARNKQARLSELRYYADEKLNNFATPMAKAQLATALALYGDETRAETAFTAAIRDLNPNGPVTSERSFGDDYGSRLRDGAATLTLISETGLRQRLLPEVVNVIDADRTATDVVSTSTQEKAWLLLAANALFDEAKTYRLDVDGKLHTGSLSRSFKSAALAKPFNVVNRGEAKARAVITVSGSPEAPEPARSAGFTIERTYYTLAGEKVDPSRVAQNTRLVTVLSVHEGKPLGGQVMVSDPLPAGFEIDNPHLVDSGDVSSLSWLPKSISPTHTEFRDDRFLAAFNLKSNEAQSLTLAYVVRAVAPGHYVHGPASVEDMYRPNRMARTDTGMVEVVSGQ